MATQYIYPTSDVSIVGFSGSYTDIDDAFGSYDGDSTTVNVARIVLNGGPCTGEFGATDCSGLSGNIKRIKTNLTARYDSGVASVNYWMIVSGTPVASGTASLDSGVAGGGYVTFTTSADGNWTQANVDGATLKFEFVSGDTPGTNILYITAFNAKIYDQAGVDAEDGVVTGARAKVNTTLADGSILLGGLVR